MNARITVSGEDKYNGSYDLAKMAEALGLELKVDSTPMKEKIAVIVEAREGQNAAAAKLINYAHTTLIKQGVETEVDYTALRTQLAEKPAEVAGPWSFIFPDSDSALFFLSVIHHTDLLKDPKWQVWFTPEDGKTESESIKVYDADHFTKHYFTKIARNYLCQLTGTDPDSDVCKFLDGVRQRVGKELDIIKSARTKLSDETKLQRMIEKIKEEDKTSCPEEFSKLQAGEMTLPEFKAATKEKKKASAAAERAAKKAASGKKAPVAKKLDPASQDRIAAAKAEIEKKKGKTAEAPAAEAPAAETPAEA